MMFRSRVYVGRIGRQQSQSASRDYSLFRRLVRKLFVVSIAAVTVCCIIFGTATFNKHHREIALLLLPGEATDPIDSAFAGVKSPSSVRQRNSSERAQSPCPGLRRPGLADIRRRNDHWQFDNGGDSASGFEIVVYSAFYDDRPSIGPTPRIRVLGVVSVREDYRKLFCQVWYSPSRQQRQQADKLYVADVESTITGRDHVLADNRTYGQRLFSCRLLPPETASNGRRIPIGVSIAVDERCARSSIFLPIYRSSPSLHPLPVSLSTDSARWQHEFVVCIESSFGSFPPEVVVEWIEAYRMFGVSRFNVYNGNLTDSESIRVLRYYADRGLVDFRHLPPSVIGDHSEEAVRLSSPTSLNDCMMRNIYIARFIIVVDIDEIIVPRLHANYSAMLDHVDRSLGLTESYHTYSFRNAYFFRYFPPVTAAAAPEHMRTLWQRHRAPPSEYMFGMKSFVDPRRCLSVFNHYCWIRFPDADTQRFSTSVDVEPSVALCHHYRVTCPADNDTCRQYDELKTVDDVMLKYGDALQTRVAGTLTDLGLMPGA